MADLRRRSKRVREDDEITGESAGPLAKRINDLHLSRPVNETVSHRNVRRQRRSRRKSHSQDLSSITEQISLNDVSAVNNECADEVNVIVNNCVNAAPEAVKQETYSPEMSETDNPYYYYTNKLLHQLHLERLRRS